MAPHMSGQLPQNYLIHTIVIAIAIVVVLVFVLSRNWGCSPTGV